jgi:hypothetical protein
MANTWDINNNNNNNNNNDNNNSHFYLPFRIPHIFALSPTPCVLMYIRDHRQDLLSHRLPLPD